MHVDLLEREQRRNAELVDKHSDLVKLQRRANCQNQSLKHLEQHSQELELSLKEMKSMLAREKQMKHSMKLEVTRLKKAMNDMEIQATDNQGDQVKELKQNTKPKTLEAPNIHKPQSNQLDTTPSPLKFRVGVATPPDSDENTSKKKVVQSEQHRRKTDKSSAVKKRSEKATATSSMTSEFSEVKQMYEEERERRRQLQEEIQELMDNLQTKKTMRGPSLELDLAVGHLASELKSSKGSRR